MGITHQSDDGHCYISKYNLDAAQNNVSSTLSSVLTQVSIFCLISILFASRGFINGSFPLAAHNVMTFVIRIRSDTSMRKLNPSIISNDFFEKMGKNVLFPTVQNAFIPRTIDTGIGRGKLSRVEYLHYNGTRNRDSLSSYGSLLMAGGLAPLSSALCVSPPCFSSYTMCPSH